MIHPLDGSTRSLSVSSVTSNVDFALSASNATRVVLTNTGNGLCYARLCLSSGAAATTGDLPILAATQVIINRNGAVNYGAITDSGATTTLKATLAWEDR
jgi:hypothetical protein